MTYEEMIAEAEKYLPDSSRGEKGHAAAAQAWLMRADLELRLQERRTAFAAEVVKKLDAMFKLSSTFMAPVVVPMAAGDGFLIRLSNYNGRPCRAPDGDHPWGAVLSWAVAWTEDFAEAGWKFQFKFDDVKPCWGTDDLHEFWYMAPNEEEWKPRVKKPMPYCCKCGAPRPVV